MMHQPIEAWSCVERVGCLSPASCGPDYCKSEHRNIAGTAGGSSTTHPNRPGDFDATGLPR